MIQDSVLQVAAEFSAVWGNLLRNHDVYKLDTTWPSVGTVDLILFPLRGREQISENEERILIGAAAYLGVLAYHSWTTFQGNIEISLKVDPENQRDFILTAKEGDSVKQTIGLISALKRALNSPLDSFPVFGGLERKLTFTHNIVSLFATGLVTGLSPFGNGLWTEKKETHMTRFVTTTAKYIAASNANYYKMLYPKDKVASEIAFHLHALSLPPAGFNEPFEYLRSSSGIIEYLQNENSTEEQIQLIAERLLSFPDELTSQSAFVVAIAATTDPHKNVKILGASQSANNSKLQLRPVINLARLLLKKPSDWLKLLEEEKTGAAKKLFIEEQALGLLPLMKLDFDFYQDPNYRPLTNVLAWSDAKVARKTIDDMPKELAARPEAWFQTAIVDFVLGDIKRAKFELEQLKQAATEQSVLLFDVLELDAICSIQQQDYAVAKSLISQALDLNISDKKRFLRVSSLLASLMFSEKKLTEAKQILDVAVEDELCPLTTLLTSYKVERSLGDDKRAKELIERLVNFAPLDRRVFDMAVDFGMYAKE